ncbi:PREDICTED: N(alpha)-acetyltransferase 38, NatC auxiliary subunit isoform X1 [Dipodomys ordii]|uniref:N-alpha-acetyltransferase 38, NatC auxiliary subunit n=1 Tax=Dipodomys ordii TaxID=10020 RepID=A0A1S3EXY3_DIPOR|nr:PREDICTED: N(alpha)-acetyltransferase 38, NatC auxiliary subunit isoform X1 [Dipodomys ordii]
MAGAGPTMLLREENGCCSRRQSNSSAGDSDGEREDSPAARARQQLEALLNKTMRIRMTDGRTLVGCFLCTDRDCNVILGSAQEFLKPSGQCPRNAHPSGNVHARHLIPSGPDCTAPPCFLGLVLVGQKGRGPTLTCVPHALTLLSRFILCGGTPCARPGHGPRTPHRFY